MFSSTGKSSSNLTNNFFNSTSSSHWCDNKCKPWNAKSLFDYGLEVLFSNSHSIELRGHPQTTPMPIESIVFNRCGFTVPRIYTLDRNHRKAIISVGCEDVQKVCERRSQGAPLNATLKEKPCDLGLRLLRNTRNKWSKRSARFVVNMVNWSVWTHHLSPSIHC